jgi:peptidoglycan/xylan/chitin deacetylase (PgdA/CDA1 family)
MAKRRTKTKSIYLKVSAKTALFCVVTFIFSIYYLLNVLKINSLHNFKPQRYPAEVISYEKFQKTILSPSPTPVSSPTEVPLKGFCLNVPILMYHHIQPQATAMQLGQTALTVDNGSFDMQMAYLAQNGYTSFFANDFINALINHQQLPAKSVIITLDDGYEDNYIYALPILQKYGIKANIMLATGLMGNSNMLSWNQVKDLKNSGLIYFANHTWSHYAVNSGNQSKIETEISTAQKQIQENTGENVNVFTYPYGSFNDNSIAILQKLGYLGAFSEIPGQTQCDSFLMTLHRTRIGNSTLSFYGL